MLKPVRRTGAGLGGGGGGGCSCADCGCDTVPEIEEKKHNFSKY